MISSKHTVYVLTFHIDTSTSYCYPTIDHHTNTDLKKNRASWRKLSAAQLNPISQSKKKNDLFSDIEILFKKKWQ